MAFTKLTSNPANSGFGLRAMLDVLVAVALLGALSIGAMSFWGASESGTAANQTFVSKDLTADFLPPPLYLIENAALVEEMATATGSLNSQAYDLVQTVAIFRLVDYQVGEKLPQPLRAINALTLTHSSIG